MNSLILFGVGLIFLIASKGIAKLIFDMQVKYFGNLLGDLLKSKEVLILKIYRIGVITGGLIVLLGAYGIVFGPVYL